ncbi:MAG TPA: diguanylate cyclase [Burkholderiales bacterium]|nr:diguanylate cyclase [Burkholderiales bacterium]
MSATGGPDALPARAGLSLRTRFLLIGLLIFVVGAAASYTVIGWFSRDVVQTLSGWFAEKSVLYEKSKVLQLLLREITLTQKMASSPLLKAWVANETDATLRASAVAELEDFRAFYRSRSYFFAIARSGHYYFNDDRAGYALQEPRYTLSSDIPKDGWFYETLRLVKDYQLNVDTDRHLGVTKVWINTVLRVKGEPLAVMGTGVDLSDFIRSVVSSAQPGVTNMLLDASGAIQAHHDVSIIDFASIAKQRRQEEQSTVYNLIDSDEHRAALRRAFAELASGHGDTRALVLSIQGREHVAGVTYLPDIKWFLLTLTYPDSALKSHYVGTVAAVLVISLGVALLVAGLAFDRLVLRRVSALDAAAARIAAGDYAIGAPPAGSDELARLGRTFAEMARRIGDHTTELETQIAERTAALERLAYADFLTGLLNRRGMIDRMEIERNRLQRHGGRLGVLIIDIDDFKAINDSYGHGVGDQALVRCANLFREAMRSYDLCARWGGEEFLIIVPGVAGAAELLATAEKLRIAIEQNPLQVRAAAVHLTVSIGCCVAMPDAPVDAIIKTADDALYRAKQQGRNRVMLADEQAGSAERQAS